MPLAQTHHHALVQTPQVWWYGTDTTGAPVELTDATGETVWRAQRLAWGNLTDEAWLAEGADNCLRLPGQYEDRETGLFYNLHRYYDPRHGRYITPDPVGLAGGLNGYAYADGDPVGRVDPLGLLAELGEHNPQNSWNRFQQAHKGHFGDSTESAAAYKRLKEEQSPWPIGYEPTQREIQIGEQFNVAMSPDQKDIHPGNFGTFDEIISVDYVRNDLAVKVPWKPEINRVTTYEVTNPFIIKEGPVGPQIDNGIYLPGGGSQLQMLFKYGLDDKMTHIKIISTKEIK